MNLYINPLSMEGTVCVFLMTEVVINSVKRVKLNIGEAARKISPLGESFLKWDILCHMFRYIIFLVGSIARIK